MNDLKHWQFSLRLEILEPYSDLNIEHRGAEQHVDFDRWKMILWRPSSTYLSAVQDR
jgi:hypothetical protein